MLLMRGLGTHKLFHADLSIRKMDDSNKSKHAGVHDLSSKRLKIFGLSKEEVLKGCLEETRLFPLSF